MLYFFIVFFNNCFEQADPKTEKIFLLGYLFSNSLWIWYKLGSFLSSKTNFDGFISNIFRANSEPIEPPAPVIKIDLLLVDLYKSDWSGGISSLPRISSINIGLNEFIFDFPLAISPRDGTLRTEILNADNFSNIFL